MSPLQGGKPKGRSMASFECTGGGPRLLQPGSGVTAQGPWVPWSTVLISGLVTQILCMHTCSFLQPTGDKLCIIRHPPLPGCVRGARMAHSNGPGSWLAAQCCEKMSNSGSHCIPGRTSIIWHSAFLLTSSHIRLRRVNLPPPEPKAGQHHQVKKQKIKVQAGLGHPIFSADMQREARKGFENHIPWEQAGEENSWQESWEVKRQAPFCGTLSGSWAPVLLIEGNGTKS